MSLAPRVVYDCNVLLQALISRRGPAFAAVEAAREGRVVLFLSQFIVDELQRVAARPSIAVRFSLTAARVAEFLNLVEKDSHRLSAVPSVFEYDRDPKDAQYVDLAVAANAQLIVSRDNDLLALGDPTRPEGRDFALRFPGLQILTPPQLLTMLAADKDV
jgi:putative PIN family toxin of toxin-antitoxin system